MDSPQTEIQQREAKDIIKAKTGDDQTLMLSADLRLIIGSAVVGTGLLIVLSFWLVASRIPFVVGAALPLLTLIAIVYRAVVYHRQWRVMKDNLRQTDRVVDKMQEQLEAMRDQVKIMGVAYDPRLQITRVEVFHLSAESEPLFIVSVKNVGAIDAEGVTINMRVSFGRPVESTLAQKLSEPQVVTIAAGQEEAYVIPWDQPIKQEHIDRLKQVPLVVSGFIKMRDGDKREFCYRYYVLKNRPPGVPQFVACDFDTRLTRVVTPGTAGVKVTAHAPIVTQGEVIPNKDKNPDAKQGRRQ